MAELWALRDGLSMCVDMQIPALEVEFDAKVVADLMNNTTSLNADFAAIVADCRQLLSQIPQIKSPIVTEKQIVAPMPSRD